MDTDRFSGILPAPERTEVPAHLHPFCVTLAQRGLAPTISTIDGNPHLLRILRLVWPAIWIQRCLVHVQRQGLSWFRRDPNRPDAKPLRALFLHVMAIHPAAHRERFLSRVQAWDHRHGRHLGRAP